MIPTRRDFQLAVRTFAARPALSIVRMTSPTVGVKMARDRGPKCDGADGTGNDHGGRDVRDVTIVRVVFVVVVAIVPGPR